MSNPMSPPRDMIGPVFDAVNKGRRIASLFEDLPRGVQEELARLAGHSLGKRSGKGGKVSRAALLKVLERSKQQGPDEVVRRWFRMYAGPKWYAGKMPSSPWKQALLYRLLGSALFKNDLIPPRVLQATDEVIAGTRPRLSAGMQTFWRQWLTLEDGLRILTVVQQLAEEGCKILESVEEHGSSVLDSSAHPLERYRHATEEVKRRIDALQQALEEADQRVREIPLGLPRLLKVAEQVRFRAPAVELEGKDGDRFLALVREDPAWLVDLETAVREALQGLPALLDQARARDLVALPARIDPALPKRDLTYFETEEVPVVRKHLEDGSPVDPERAPVLTLLGKVFLDDQPLDEAGYAVIEETMTGRFCRLLREGVYRLGDAPAATELEDQPEAGEVSEPEEAAGEEPLEEPAPAPSLSDRVEETDALEAPVKVAHQEDQGEQREEAEAREGDRENEGEEEEDDRVREDGQKREVDETNERPGRATGAPEEVLEEASTPTEESSCDAAGEKEEEPLAPAESEPNFEAGRESAAPPEEPTDRTAPSPPADLEDEVTQPPAEAPRADEKQAPSDRATTAVLETDAGETETVPAGLVEMARAGDSAGVARVLQNIQESARPHLSQYLLAALLADADLDTNLDLAYWFVVASRQHSPLCLEVVEAVRLGVQYQPGFQDSTIRLKHLFDELLPKRVEHLCRAEALLLAASMVRPTLMATRQIKPEFLLEKLRGPLSFLPGYHEFSERLLDFARQNIPLAGPLLRHLNFSTDWEARRQELELETLDWIENAPRRTIKYQDATRLWVHWTSARGEVRELVEAARSGETDFRALEEELDEWRSAGTFRKRLDRTYNQIKQARSGKVIRHGALEALHRLTLDAVYLAERWLELHQTRPVAERGVLAHGRRVLERLDAPARTMLEALAQPHPDWSVLEAAGAVRLRRALDEVIHRFDEGTTARRVHDPMENRELLLFPECAPLDPDRLVRGDDETQAIRFQAAIINHLVEPREWESALNGHLEHGTLQEASRLLDLHADDLDERHRERLERAIREARRKWKARIQGMLQDARDNLDRAHFRGVLDDQAHLDLVGRVERIEQVVDQVGAGPLDPGDAEPPPWTRDFVTLAREAHTIEEEIDQAANRKRQELARRIEDIQEEWRNRFSTPLPDRVMQSAKQALDNDEVTLVEEVLARVEQAIEKGDASEERLVPGVAESAEPGALLKPLTAVSEMARDIRQVLHRVKNRDCSVIPGLADWTPERQESFEDVLTAWKSLLDLYRTKKFDTLESADWIGTVLRWLGYRLKPTSSWNMTHRSGPPHFWRTCTARGTIRSPIPLFGSMAHEQHRVVLVWGNPGPEATAQWLEDMNGGIDPTHAVIILSFSTLAPRDRLRFVGALRAARYAPLLIDTTLLVWLGRFDSTDRTREMFRIALAGAANNPYTPEIAGSVPEEMFFGRERDIEALWREDGPCIVYGGRQLGKSALLRQVERRYHAPDQDRFVLYLGAKHTSDLWTLLYERLRQEGLLTRPQLRKPESIKSEIRVMLKEHPSRRLLVLVDECDYLLDEDSKKRFSQISLVRDLMTETNRRFKIVLTGLHNVQRFQRIPNHPLAHFGEPLCVGPLPLSDAANLVRKPLTALGYRFEKDFLVDRVLAHTNYHPGLIQLFCRELLDRMLKKARVDRQESLPIVITQERIAEVYRKVDLANKMRDRFEWTLDLDKRYRVLAYTFALEEYWSEGGRDGIRARDLLAKVQETWPGGFEETRTEELEGLLEELVGLGILRKTPSGRFRLRSPNVLRLIGGPDVVTENLARFEKEPFEVQADAQVIHLLLRGDKSQEASPLTWWQENQIRDDMRRVILVVGSPALAIGRVWDKLPQLWNPRQLQERKDQVHSCVLEAGSDPDRCLEQVRKEYSKRRDVPNLNIRLRADDQDLAPSALVQTLQKFAKWLQGLRSEKRAVRLCCVVDAPVWYRLSVSGMAGDLKRDAQLRILNLRRWKRSGLLHWFDDVERPPSASLVDHWMDQTNGWPFLLEPCQRAFLEKRKEEPNPSVPLPDPGTFLEQVGLRVDDRLFEFYYNLAIFSEGGEGLSPQDLEDIWQESQSSAQASDQGTVEPILEYLSDLDLVTTDGRNHRAERIAAGMVERFKKRVGEG